MKIFLEVKALSANDDYGKQLFAEVLPKAHEEQKPELKLNKDVKAALSITFKA